MPHFLYLGAKQAHLTERGMDHRAACLLSSARPRKLLFMWPSSPCLYPEMDFPLPAGGLALDPSARQEVLLALCTHQAPILRGLAQPSFVLQALCLTTCLERSLGDWGP